MSHGSNAEFCTRLTRERDFWSFAASLLVEPSAQRAWHALAAFNAEVAHVRDHIREPMAGEVRLQWWRDVADGLRHDEAQGNPVAAELLRAIEQYDLPREAIGRLIDAHVFDVYDDPMPDIAALEAHCRDTQGALYRLRAMICGRRDPGAIADHGGVAHGLVDVMLSLPRNAARRQLYLPADLLAVHAATAEQIFAQEGTAGLYKIIADLRGEAERQLDLAWALLGDTPVDMRRAFLPLAPIRTTLERLKTSDPFTPPQLSRLRVLWTTWTAARSRTFNS